MASSPERNDRKRGKPERFHSRKPGGPAHSRGPGERGGADWLWGWHAVTAALENPRRGPPRRLLATADRAKKLTEQFGRIATLEILEPKAIDAALAVGAVHQGVALKPEPLEPLSIDELAGDGGGFILMLDQVTDPQNVGAIFRSAAAFGARGVILQDRHAPVLTGALAKAAAGLSGTADEALADVLDSRPTVLVLGSEGEGIRRLVSEHCDALGRIPMPGGFESLNVSAAAAIALYEVSRTRKFAT